MSRSGYSEDVGGWELICWRGAVKSAIRGKRGQAMLKELLTALDTLPQKRLIAHEIEKDGEVCALGSLARARAINADTLDPYDHEGLGATFNVSPKLVQEIEFINDDWASSPEERFAYVRRWVVNQLAPPTESERTPVELGDSEGGK